MIDECGRIRHFFANLALCKHKIRIKKTTFKGNLSETFHDHYRDIPVYIPDISDDQNLTKEVEGLREVFEEVYGEGTPLTTEEHLKAVCAAWNTVMEFRTPFSSIMGQAKWVEIAIVFFDAAGHLGEDEEDDLTPFKSPEFEGVFDKITETIEKIDKEEDEE
ncbi:MAG: hypothetical protein IIC79_00010 [Chloroflexi bacterium]|nr:hypothetical protein [Chloroflexota bacterium]